MGGIAINKISEDPEVRDLLGQFDSDGDKKLEAKEVDTDGDGLIDCNHITQPWFYTKLGPVENALFNAGLVKKLRNSICDTRPQHGLVVGRSGPYTNSLKPWWDKIRYTMSDFFEKNPYIYHRELPRVSVSRLVSNYINPGKRTPKTPLHTALSRNHFFGLPNGLPADFVPSGRIGDGLKFDEKFYANTQDALTNLGDLQGKLFINYTGHQGGVGAAMADRGIPVYWQLTGNERIINSMRDFSENFQRNTFTQSNSAGILLEPNHGGSNIDISRLPNAELLKGDSIREIVIFTETRPTEDVPSDSYFKKYNPAFQVYVDSLKANGFAVRIIGVDTRR